MLYKIVELALNFIKGNDVNEDNFTFKTVWLILLFLGTVLGYVVYLSITDWVNKFGELRVHELQLQQSIIELKDQQINKLETKILELSNELELLDDQNHTLEMNNLQCSLELDNTKTALKDKSIQGKVISERLTSCLTTYHTRNTIAGKP